MEEWAVVAAGAAASLITVIGGVMVAVLWYRMGGGTAQRSLNVTLKELNDAYEDKLNLRDEKIAMLETEFSACKGRLEAVEEAHARDREEWLEEKITLKQELDAVYRRLGMTKRDTDPNEATP